MGWNVVMVRCALNANMPYGHQAPGLKFSSWLDMLDFVQLLVNCGSSLGNIDGY